jgi:hypothetical protein
MHTHNSNTKFSVKQPLQDEFITSFTEILSILLVHRTHGAIVDGGRTQFLRH